MTSIMFTKLFVNCISSLKRQDLYKEKKSIIYFKLLKNDTKLMDVIV
jgi:hypothetical protein